MTLLDLATHRSGLPHDPNNLHSSDKYDPYAGYAATDLYAFLNYWGVSRSPHPSLLYSNLGFGLLGHALANRAGATYPELLSHITEPLGMHDTVINLSSEQRTRLIQGYSGPHSPVGAMDLGVLEGAGAIQSTAPDMLRYLNANLHPEQTPHLQAALEFSHQLRGQFAPQGSIALAWLYDMRDGIYRHDGAMAGYTSDAFFSPAGDYAVVVLANSGPDLFQFASVLGEHIRERLTSQRAISLNTAVVPASKGGALDFFRILFAWWITMFAAGAFIYCCVLGVQGIMAQLLPRRSFLRFSSYTQLTAFGIFVIVYFLEPKLVSPADLALQKFDRALKTQVRPVLVALQHLPFRDFTVEEFLGRTVTTCRGPNGCVSAFKGSTLTLGRMGDACIYYGGSFDADTKANPAPLASHKGLFAQHDLRASR